jgi:phenylpropionate dioxygenase-like ring-hydroxylating dioxygenase large terminal subunit
MSGSPTPGSRAKGRPFSGYYKTAVPSPDLELASAGPGTVLGEYMRRFWQPVCMSSQLTDVPRAIRILDEDLVAFRDRSGRVGVLHKHCCHRGASLEFGVIQECGIRCSYHGLHFDVDGALLEAPGERDKGARLRESLSQGAYPAVERDGLVFAYMGPPEDVPPFPEYDAFEAYDDTRLLPFSNVFPCNWLQVLDNIPDQMHTAFLHNTPFLYGGKVPEGIDWQRLTLASFAKSVPVMDYVAVRGGSAMCYIAGRRMSDALVWIRIQDLVVPNIGFHGYLFEDGSERRLFHRVNMARWYVPVDDTHSIVYGWRMFGRTADPRQQGDEGKVGWDSMDFLDGQVGNRPYEVGQRGPGDWEVITSQRAIAVHALENPMESDIGVYLFRKLLREAIRGKSPDAQPASMHERARRGLPSYCYTQNDVLAVPKRPTEEEDRAMLKRLGRQIIAIAQEADTYALQERKAFVSARLEQLEKKALDL